MRSTLSLTLWPGQISATRPPHQNTDPSETSPHDTDGKSDLDQIAARALVGQVTPIGKGNIRQHYEALLAHLRGELGADHV